MIPEWSINGDLPPGVYETTLPEIEERLAFNARRRRLFEGFRRACNELARAGCRLVYLDGSFITSKIRPADFDACWSIEETDDRMLNPVFFDFSNGRAGQKQCFGGEILPAQLPEGATGRSFVEFFQMNRVTGEPKGILAIRLSGRRRRSR